ncbi:MAG TPA: GlsB/YeaQ/YmgE family stress response membrane protein [Thermodesulfobacteriota bacterium]|nr:GlsB/YeaQ/YmgE family stress response membrane protein [Thermodesulfobacteriota bacterium]
MGILAWIILGLIAGAIAKLILPGKDPGGIIVTILIGIVGALLGGFIGTQLGFGTVNALDIRSIIIAILGAIILLLIYRMVVGRRRTI